MSDVRLYFGPVSSNLAQKALEYAHELLGRSTANLREYFPEGKTAMHSIASVRSLINEAMTRPFESLHKVLIVHGADRMLPSSANALLKTLEEPFETTHILLLTHDIDAMLPTILSRCKKYPFASDETVDVLPVEEIDKLKDKDPYAWTLAVDRHLEGVLETHKEVPQISELVAIAREGILCNMKLKNVLDGLQCQIQEARHST